MYVTGNPLGILTTIKLYVAVIRQTALEMRGVPENLKEAAVAFIVFKWQLLKDIEIQRALPSIMTGINQSSNFDKPVAVRNRLADRRRRSGPVDP